MKKNKTRLREKIRNKPKARNSAKRRKKTDSANPNAMDFNRAATQPDDSGIEVMSHIILDFAAPLLETCSDEASERKAISLAIFVWNAALLPEPECRQTLEVYLEDCRKVMPLEEFTALSGYVDQLLETRKTRYGANRKKITNCTFGDYGSDRHIEIGYTIE